MTKRDIFIIVVLVLAGVAGYYVWQNSNKNIQPEQINYEPGGTCDETNSISSDCLETPQAGQEGQIKTPNLDRAIKNLNNLSDDVMKIATDKINSITRDLNQSPDFVDNWLELGFYRKTIGDYEGAKEAWEYAGKIDPKSSTPFNNLGDLYAYRLKNNTKAEENFSKAIENGPREIYIYRNFYEFYLNVMKDNEKAKEILKKGIDANPGMAQDLQILFDNL